MISVDILGLFCGLVLRSVCVCVSLSHKKLNLNLFFFKELPQGAVNEAESTTETPVAEFQVMIQTNT